MNWALRRQLFYVFIVILLALLIAFLIIFPQFNKPPTCSDGIQNGNETGIDCGGSCPNACLSQVIKPAVLWERAFEVVPGRYNAVAYIVNYNKTYAAEKVSYRFRFADENNIFIASRDGVATIPPGTSFAIFEPAIGVGNSIPVYTTFEFTSTPNWIQVSQDKINQLKILFSNITLSGENTAPKLSATVTNGSLFKIPDLNVVSILYDTSGNAVSVSNTYLNELDPLQALDINFTWPQLFSTPVVKKEFLPIYDIFSVQLQ
jgi:hypothetical protein